MGLHFFPNVIHPMFTREEEGSRDSLVVGLAYSPKNMIDYFLEKTKQNKIFLVGNCLSRPLRSVSLWFPWSCWRGQEGGLAPFGYMVWRTKGE